MDLPLSFIDGPFIHVHSNTRESLVNPIKNRTIYPVILPVPEEGKSLRRREKVVYLSRHARVALNLSAEKSRIRLGKLLKDADGTPLPSEGSYWSLSHKSDYVAAVVSTSRTGIDVEEIRPCSEALFKKVANDREWSLFDKTSDHSAHFFRCWTAKEAVLKATGTGFKGISKCRIERILDDTNLVINYMDLEWFIEHFFFNGHIASVVKNEFQIQWTVSSVPTSPNNS